MKNKYNTIGVLTSQDASHLEFKLVPLELHPGLVHVTIAGYMHYKHLILGYNVNTPWGGSCFDCSTNVSDLFGLQLASH